MDQIISKFVKKALDEIELSTGKDMSPAKEEFKKRTQGNPYANLPN